MSSEAHYVNCFHPGYLRLKEAGKTKESEDEEATNGWANWAPGNCRSLDRCTKNKEKCGIHTAARPVFETGFIFKLDN